MIFLRGCVSGKRCGVCAFVQSMTLEAEILPRLVSILCPLDDLLIFSTGVLVNSDTSYVSEARHSLSSSVVSL
jgi:hypothetical protein